MSTTAGLIHFYLRPYHIHLLVRPNSWVWGYERYSWTGQSWGLGPLFLVRR